MSTKGLFQSVFATLQQWLYVRRKFIDIFVIWGNLEVRCLLLIPDYTITTESNFLKKSFLISNTILFTVVWKI